MLGHKQEEFGHSYPKKKHKRTKNAKPKACPSVNNYFQALRDRQSDLSRKMPLD